MNTYPPPSLGNGDPSGTPDRFNVLGIGVSIVTLDVALSRLITWSGDRHGRFVCIRDAHGIMHARHDAEFAQIHREAAMVTPDGMPLAVIGKMRGLPVERTCGPDLLLTVLDASPANGLKHYFYGGRDGVADALARKMRARVSGLNIVGIETPPFVPLDDDELAELAHRINGSQADIIWIGLSTPKQERLMQRLRPLVTGTLIGVGAAYDVHAGLIRRAPQWMQRMCLEGVYRFTREPRRLWKRYLVMAPKFAFLAAFEQITGRYARASTPTSAGVDTP